MKKEKRRDSSNFRFSEMLRVIKNYWIALPIAVSAHRVVAGHHGRSIPVTNRLHLLFSAILAVSLLIGTG